MASAAKKNIPKVSTPCEQSRDIDGITWTVRRLPGTRAPAVISRLLADVGEVVAEVLCSPDRDLDPDLEIGLRAVVATQTGVDGSQVATRVIKAIVFSGALGRAKNIDLAALIESLLSGQVAANGVPLDSMAELDETGIGGDSIVALLVFALQVNFFPISAGSATSHGNAGPVMPQGHSQPTHVRGTSSLRGDDVMGGPAAQTSQRIG